MSAAKVIHVDAGSGWGEVLALAVRRFYLSTRRGKAPPPHTGQSEPLLFDVLFFKSLPDDPMVNNGPVGNHNLLVLFTYFLLREVDGVDGEESHCYRQRRAEGDHLASSGFEDRPNGIGL